MITICVSDFWYGRQYMQLDDHNELIELPTKPWRSTKRKQSVCTTVEDTKREPCKTLRRLYLLVDGIKAFYLIREIRESSAFRHRLTEKPALQQTQLLWLQLEPPEKEIIDYKWNELLTHKLWEKIEVDTLMSWLSTLGGGYSALGEQFSTCAEIAGKISLRQLSIGLRLGDPLLQTRCKLYYSISLIQMGKLRTAKYIVREQYKFAKQVKHLDGRLLRMCEGIWRRIQYEYERRLGEKARRRQLQAAGDRAS